MKNTIITIVAIILLSACSKGKKIIVTNELDFARREVVSIPLKDVSKKISDFFHIEDENGEVVPMQLVEANGADADDVLLLDVAFTGKSSRSFVVVESEGKQSVEDGTFGRLVPERIDDFAWENDLVAFRTYGPEAQRLVDANEKGGTLSSGIDCWLKRVNYPIIDKWYAKYVAGGTYHKDDGEGYDPYHVGASRGCGGLGFLAGDSLFVSKNFTSHRVITNGPLRTVFELTYAPWSANGVGVEERKIITIDRGQQFCKVEAHLQTDSSLNFTVGITLHDKKGEAKLDSTTGCFRYWETIDDSSLGTAVVIDPASILRSQDFRTEKKDLSHIYVTAKHNGVLTYYPGFAWQKAGKITSKESWDKHLAEFSKRLQAPVKVSVQN
ncbi:DUF4861 family protein [Pseudochryseolinea flava]|uniref:DUF4861 domain-containing protein n=1 Tax=Pseudochryseolinea flava TaxID=2059302 RepID=A0A364Y1Y0_9BACT|nr:DUF4861 family protein [Pseudochryseolinea flava]RAW00883.1 DUF4861 domain-containing protein [Pseudochryseolinea flava]